ncbi:MAG TPA: hypothetical protein VGX25_18805 [Actinophytocola sp.]|uniref:hypothetical protein n=1 Tax=Actinophytocola sp. TaxID=1872138 RepID=UPI002DDCACD5|nr:hypothetical protein [Actinophytocola sp.]HEV2781437.1 hypothetical protein [Actinophytocola sp.]
MLILGLLLVVLSAAAAALLLAYNWSGGPEQMIVLFGRDLVSVSPLEAFLSGMAIALLFCLGLWMVISTGRRRRVARAQYRDARREARAAGREAQAAARERDKLAEQLEKERAAGTSTGADWKPPARTTAPSPADETATPPRGIGRHFRRRRTEDVPGDQPTSSR